MKKSAIIVAGGAGTRMGGSRPKQYLKLGGKAVILHSIERLIAFDPDMALIIVIAPGHREYWEEAIASINFTGHIMLTEGGSSRFNSVKNGLALVAGDGLVGIHDAARPLVSHGTLQRVYDSAKAKGSGIPVVPLVDTIRKEEEDGSSKHMDRSRLRAVQTPQAFRSRDIQEAYKQEYHAAFTDDASVYESLYGRVELVPGNLENIKITTKSDLQLAEVLIGQHG